MTSTLDQLAFPRTAAAASALDDALASFSGVQHRLLDIADRILGDRTEAEDVVQEVWIRWQGCDRGAVLNPTAFLVTATTRLALNLVQTARVRHQSAFDERPSEIADRVEDPTAELERAEATERGLLVLCERLAPTERAAFVLRTAFDHPYDRIAEILGVSEANARQLVSRAGRRVTSERRRPVDPDLHRDLTRAFLAASLHGSVTALEQLLAAGAGITSGESSSGSTSAPLRDPVEV